MFEIFKTRRLKRGLVLALVFVMSLSNLAFAQEGTEINFACINFENAVRELNGVPASGPVLAQHVEAIERLHVANRGITSLSGIEYFAALEVLAAQNNNIATLDLRANSNLSNIVVQNSNINTLYVEGLTNLVHLNASNNKLVTLNVTGLTSLTGLSVSRNNLTGIVGLNTLSALNILWAEANNFAALDLSSVANPVLNAVDVRGNGSEFSQSFIDDMVAMLGAADTPVAPSAHMRARISQGFAYSQDDAPTTSNDDPTTSNDDGCEPGECVIVSLCLICRSFPCVRPPALNPDATDINVYYIGNLIMYGGHRFEPGPHIIRIMDGADVISITNAVANAQGVLSTNDRVTLTTSDYTVLVNDFDGDLVLNTTVTVSPSVARSISFDPRGGTVAPTSMQTSLGGRLASLPTPTRDDHEFLGWHTTVCCGLSVSEDVRFSDDVALYAQWRFIGAAYRATFLGQLAASASLVNTPTPIFDVASGLEDGGLVFHSVAPADFADGSAFRTEIERYTMHGGDFSTHFHITDMTATIVENLGTEQRHRPAGTLNLPVGMAQINSSSEFGNMGLTWHLEDMADGFAVPGLTRYLIEHGTLHMSNVPGMIESHGIVLTGDSENMSELGRHRLTDLGTGVDEFSIRLSDFEGDLHNPAGSHLPNLAYGITDFSGIMDNSTNLRLVFFSWGWWDGANNAWQMNHILDRINAARIEYDAHDYVVDILDVTDLDLLGTDGSLNSANFVEAIEAAKEANTDVVFTITFRAAPHLDVVTMVLPIS